MTEEERTLHCGFMIDIEGSNSSPGAHMILWTKNNPTSSNQQFEFNPHVTAEAKITFVSHRNVELIRFSCAIGGLGHPT